MLIWGAQDNIVPVAAAEEYHRRIPNSRLEVIENCAHHPEPEATEQFAA